MSALPRALCLAVGEADDVTYCNAVRELAHVGA